MEFAIAYPARPDAWKDLVIAEDQGFTHAWFYDSQMIDSDVYVCLAMAAEHTKRIKLGTGVAIPSNRIEPVTAHSIATINLLAPGRAMLGVGTGFTGAKHGPAAGETRADARVHPDVPQIAARRGGDVPRGQARTRDPLFASQPRLYQSERSHSDTRRCQRAQGARTHG